jgi:hypothetical protein
MTYQEICDRILLEAQRGGEKAEQANLNSQSVIEAMMPSMLQEITLRYARSDSDKQSLLRQTHAITLTNGVGTIPANVLTTCIWGSTVDVADEPEITQAMSYTPWNSFISPSSLDDLMGRYSIRGDHELYWADPGEVYPDLTRDGEVSLTIATTLAIPAAATDQTGWPAEAESDVIDLGANWLRGEKIAA